MDAEGRLRAVQLFELKVVQEPASVSVGQDAALADAMLVQASDERTTDLSEIEAEAPGTDLETGIAIERLRARLLAIHPREFEFVVKKAFEATGHVDVAVTRYSQDGGIDVLASFGPWGWAVRRWQVQIQAKRWLHTVGRKEVAELRGSLTNHGLGCLITTSHFSRAALAEANEGGKPPITLVNGREFAKLLIANRIDMTPAHGIPLDPPAPGPTSTG